MHTRQTGDVWKAGLICGLLLLVCQSAQAQLGISPTIVEMRSYPGGLSTFTISVSNSGDKVIDCTVEAFALKVEGGGLPVPVDDAPRSCKDWLTVESQKFALSPKSGKRLVWRLRPPRDAAGGYYAIVSCHGAPRGGTRGDSEETGVKAGIRFSYRVMAVVMVTIPAPQLKALIDAAQPTITLGAGRRGFALEVPVRNQGNIHARLQGTVELRSEAGQVVDRFELTAGRGFILPGHERLFESRGTVSLPDGLYVANIQLDVQGSGRPMRNAFPFHVMDGKPSFAEVTDELRRQIEKQSTGFTVSPPQMGVSLRAGGRRTRAAELANLTREPVRVLVRVMEWQRTPTGEDLVLEKDPPHGRSGRDLISLRDEEIELRPLARRRVPLTISLPREAEGERYAAVAFDRADIQLDVSPAGRARRSVLIGVHAQGTGAAEAEMTDFEAVRKPNGVVVLTIRFRNTGDMLIEPEVVFYIEDEDNNIVARVRSATAALVQAGGEGIVSDEWTEVLDPGRYTARVSFRFATGQPPISQRATFVVPKPPETAEPQNEGTEEETDE